MGQKAIREDYYVSRKVVYYLFVVCFFALASAGARAQNPASTKSIVPSLMQAKVYDGVSNLRDYWVSEKLDGVRAYWDGTQLLSRNGHVY
ncbi:MAG: DNA ligase-1 [Bermanella sp.]|jgi:DNA ligase-1